MESLRGLDQNLRYAFALEIIQSAISRQADKDAFLETLKNEGLKIGKRWYDKDDVFHSAIEMLKFLPPAEVQELFRDTIISMMYENEDISRQRHMRN